MAIAFVLGLNMWSLIQNEVQQGFMNFQLTVVVDQAQLPKFVHEIFTRARVAPISAASVSWFTFTARFRTKVVAIIGQQQKSPCQPHLTGIEQLVDQVRFDSGWCASKDG